MLNLDLPLQPSQRFVLVEEERTTRAQTRKPVHLEGWVELSPPATVALTAALIGDDKELSAFWEAERDRHRYDYVALGCGFGPADGEVFERAWLEVALEGSDGGKPPTAWSMGPREIVDVATITRSGKLGGKLELLSGEVQQQVQRQHKTYFIRAFRERESNPYWEFRDTPGSRLAGSFRLHLIVRSPRDSVSRGRVSLSVSVARRRFLIFSSREAFGLPASESFELPVS